MPIYSIIPLEYIAYEGGNDVFVKGRKGFSASFGKITRANSERQSHFEAQLHRIADSLGTNDIPVFIQWNDVANRMDRGCVGHSIVRRFLELPVEGDGSIVTHVRIRE